MVVFQQTVTLFTNINASKVLNAISIPQKCIKCNCNILDPNSYALA